MFSVIIVRNMATMLPVVQAKATLAVVVGVVVVVVVVVVVAETCVSNVETVDITQTNAQATHQEKGQMPMTHHLVNQRKPRHASSAVLSVLTPRTQTVAR